jgi:hypothetical protein
MLATKPIRSFERRFAVFPSGQWEGFWQQESLGRQSMTAFSLSFDGGEIHGKGRDVIGPFTFSGAYDVQSGTLVMMKQYLGKHRVVYRGQPDGEGCIAGTWSIGDLHTGSFRIRPIVAKPRGDEPIQEIT